MTHPHQPTSQELLGSQLKEIRLALAEHYIDIDQPAKALELLSQPDVADFDNPYYWRLRASALCDLERFSEAGKIAEQGLKKAPDDVRLLYFLSFSKHRLGSLWAAKRIIEQALQIGPREPWMLAYYAHLLVMSERWAEVDKVLAEALLSAPDDPQVLKVQLVAARVRGRVREAMRLNRRLLTLDVDDPEVHRNAAELMFVSGGPRRAARHWNTAARLAPEDEGITTAVRRHRSRAYLSLISPYWAISLLVLTFVWVSLAICVTAGVTLYKILAFRDWTSLLIILPFGAVIAVLYFVVWRPLLRLLRQFLLSGGR